MADKLSLPNLLALLDVDQYKDDSDRQIKDLCEKAEGLRRCRDYEEAINKAKYARQVAKEKPYPSLHGMALLYLSLAQYSCISRDQKSQAIRHCEEAITNLSNPSLGTPHNHAVAEVFRAQLELGVHGDNPASIHKAIQHLERAVERLNDFVRDYRASQESRDRELAFMKLLRERISRLSKLQGEGSPISAGSYVQSASSSNRPTLIIRNASPIDLRIPTQLVWPIPDTRELDLEPVQRKPAAQELLSGLDASAPDHIEISQFLINGKLYEAHPIGSKADIHGTTEYFESETYVPIPVIAKKRRGNRYVLVRQQRRPDQPNQRVVVIDWCHERAWVLMATDDLSLIPPRIIGGIDDARTGIRDLWERDAPTRLKTVRHIAQGAQMVGVVEAVLVPARSAALSSSSQYVASSTASSHADNLSERS